MPLQDGGFIDTKSSSEIQSRVAVSDPKMIVISLHEIKKLKNREDISKYFTSASFAIFWGVVSVA